MNWDPDYAPGEGPQRGADVQALAKAMRNFALDNVTTQNSPAERLARALFPDYRSSNTAGIWADNPDMESMALGMAGPIAFHGSPHVFDKFSMQKIGTGEGAQAYGHGLYFTSSPKVAEQYRSGLTATKVGLREGVTVSAAKDRLIERMHRLADLLSDVGQSQKTRRQANYMRKLDEDMLPPGTMATIARDYGVAADDLFDAPPGAFYQVDIPDNLLDYDKPLREQAPEVKSALEMAWVKNRAEGGMPLDAAINHAQTVAQDMKAEAILRLMERKGPADVSAQLKSAGIPGHRYRGDSSGVENYVMYDDAQIKPLGRYGSMAEYLAAAMKKQGGE